MPEKKRVYRREPEAEQQTEATEFLENFLTKNAEANAEAKHIDATSPRNISPDVPPDVPPDKPDTRNLDVEKAASLERLGKATHVLAEKLAQKQADREAGLDEPRYFWNRKKNSPDQAGNFSMLGTASTMGLHMVSGPIAGGVLGWLIDSWLNSAPIGLGIGILLGLAAGFRNVWADARHLIKGQNSDASGKNTKSSQKN